MPKNKGLRCPRCGSIPHYFITDELGENYYECNAALTSESRRTTAKDTGGGFMFIYCNTIIDSTGKLFTGTILFRQGDKPKFLTVKDGRL